MEIEKALIDATPVSFPGLDRAPASSTRLPAATPVDGSMLVA